MAGGCDIRVPDAARGHGHATAAMHDLTGWADREGVTVGLTPADDFGASTARLRTFYGRFGFQANQGRSRDHRLATTMIRPAADERVEPPPAPRPSPVNSVAALRAELEGMVAAGEMTRTEADEILASVT
jgi:hypothetical protein